MSENFWPATLNQLQQQMTQATFNNWLAGTFPLELTADRLVIGVATAPAKDWLEHRLGDIIGRAVASVLGREVELLFQVSPRPANGASTAPAVPELQPVDLPEDEPASMETGGDSPGLVVASADYYHGYFEKGGAGFSLVAHHSEYFWLALLGPAFMLWKILDADDPRPLKSIGPNYWTRPRRYSYEEMSRRLNREQGRYICGEALECHHSRQWRKEGRPLRDPANCCLSPNFDLLRISPHPAGAGLICKHWSRGLLEVLHQEGLAIVQLSEGQRKPALQIWRMPPLLTPAQYARFTAELQSQYDAWLDQYGPLFGIPHRDLWRVISVSTLAPLMPGYELSEIQDNFEQRPARQEFVKSAFSNPNFNPEGQDDEL